jgi:hypothetical protein
MNDDTLHHVIRWNVDFRVPELSVRWRYTTLRFMTKHFWSTVTRNRFTSITWISLPDYSSIDMPVDCLSKCPSPLLEHDLFLQCLEPGARPRVSKAISGKDITKGRANRLY